MTQHTTPPTIYKLIELSTGHLSEETARFLDSTPTSLWPVAGVRTHYGFLIIVPETEERSTPDDLKDCINLARSKNCPYLLLDRDARPISQLKRYDW